MRELRLNDKLTLREYSGENLADLHMREEDALEIFRCTGLDPSQYLEYLENVKDLFVAYYDGEMFSLMGIDEAGCFHMCSSAPTFYQKKALIRHFKEVIHFLVRGKGILYTWSMVDAEYASCIGWLERNSWKKAEVEYNIRGYRFYCMEYYYE